MMTTFATRQAPHLLSLLRIVSALLGSGKA